MEGDMAVSDAMETHRLALKAGYSPAEQYQTKGQALPIDISNFLTSFLMSGRPAAAAQYRQTRPGSPM